MLNYEGEFPKVLIEPHGKSAKSHIVSVWTGIALLPLVATQFPWGMQLTFSTKDIWECIFKNNANKQCTGKNKVM